MKKGILSFIKRLKIHIHWYPPLSLNWFLWKSPARQPFPTPGWNEEDNCAKHMITIGASEFKAWKCQTHRHNKMQNFKEKSGKIQNQRKCQTHRHIKMRSKSSERRCPSKARRAQKYSRWLLARKPKKRKILEPIILSLLSQALATLQPEWSPFRLENTIW